MTKKMLKSFEERTITTRERCYVHGCDGYVDRVVQPVLYTPQDLEELGYQQFTKKVDGAPKDAVICDTAMHADCTIMKCCVEAVAYAKALDAVIAFDFNGFPVIARKTDDPEWLWRDWWKRMSGGKTYEQSAMER